MSDQVIYDDEDNTMTVRVFPTPALILEMLGWDMTIDNPEILRHLRDALNQALGDKH